MANSDVNTVCYLTGAPATGKSTLCELLLDKYQNVKVFSYSKELRDHVNAKYSKLSLNEDSIRQFSAKVISKDDVREVDQYLVNFINRYRYEYNIVIDSHPVTKENFGFRVTAFKVVDLMKLNIDRVFCLYASSSIIKQRIVLNPQGRPLPSSFELDVHCNAQISIAIQYGLTLGKPCYLLDSSVDKSVLLDTFAKLSGLETDPRES